LDRRTSGKKPAGGVKKPNEFLSQPKGKDARDAENFKKGIVTGEKKASDTGRGKKHVTQSKF